MREKILDKILTIEKEKKIKIWFACESGSRGWGFPSPESDYDVRFIYSRDRNVYLSIFEPELYLNFAIDDELDINGWDLKKTLQLIKKSNTTPFEWLQSPIIYKEEVGFKEELLTICNQYFNQRSNIFHYLGVAKGAMETITEGEEIKIKKLFYILRPLLAAQWCKEKNEIAPMTIQKLLELLPANLKNLIRELIKYKKDVDESYIITIDRSLRNYINTTFQDCVEFANTINPITFNKDILDQFFMKKMEFEQR